jgi:hydrogenase maturation protease
VDPDGVLVIGYGSDLRGDDAAGPLAARLLRDRGIDAIAVHQLTPELAERIARSGTVFFLDADANVPAGEVSIEPICAEDECGLVEHYATPGALLRLARDAFGATPEAWMVAMGGSCFDLSEGLSAPAQSAAAQAVRMVLERTRQEPPCVKLLDNVP